MIKVIPANGSEGDYDHAATYDVSGLTDDGWDNIKLISAKNANKNDTVVNVTVSYDVLPDGFYVQTLLLENGTYKTSQYRLDDANRVTINEKKKTITLAVTSYAMYGWTNIRVTPYINTDDSVMVGSTVETDVKVTIGKWNNASVDTAELSLKKDEDGDYMIILSGLTVAKAYKGSEYSIGLYVMSEDDWAADNYSVDDYAAKVPADSTVIGCITDNESPISGYAVLKLLRTNSIGDTEMSTVSYPCHYEIPDDD